MLFQAGQFNVTPEVRDPHVRPAFEVYLLEPTNRVVVVQALLESRTASDRPSEHAPQTKFMGNAVGKARFSCTRFACNQERATQVDRSVH